MRKDIKFSELQELLLVLSMLRKLSLLDSMDYIVMWEKKPQVILNGHTFEMESPEETYGCTINFWDKDGNCVSKTRFVIRDVEEEDEG